MPISVSCQDSEIVVFIWASAQTAEPLINLSVSLGFFSRTQIYEKKKTKNFPISIFH